MNKLEQDITGNRNIQIGINNGDIVYTNRIIKKVEVVYDPDLHISSIQAKILREKINEVVELRAIVEQKEKSTIYKKVYGELYNHFNIESYKSLPKEQFDEAVKWLSQQNAYRYRPKLRKIDNDEYRKQLYKAIHAKANFIPKGTKRYSIEKGI